jgi:hypothetical protein
LEHLEKLFDKALGILAKELQRLPPQRVGLFFFFMAEDAKILSKFEKLVNQLNSASLVRGLVTSNRSYS